MAHNWIIAHDGTKGVDAYALECLRCGEMQRFAVPINLDIWLAAAKVFQRQHAKCKDPTAATKESRHP